MGLIKWNDHYSVNIREVDEQHKKLISLINQMYDAMLVSKGKEVLGPVLTELVNYTVYHFNTEERLFQQYGYPEYDEHKRIHDDLTMKAKQLKTAFDQGNNLISIDVMMFLSNWLNTHILEEDKRYGPFLNNKGVH
jgi:hemerythrin